MKVTILALLLSVLSGCVSMGGSEQRQAPEITDSTSTDDAVEAAIDFGGLTLERTKALITQRGEREKVSQEMESYIKKHVNNEEKQLVYAMHLYLHGTKKASVSLFESLVQSKQSVSRVLGWNLAANLPSRDIMQAMDREFTRRVNNSEEDILMNPAMASAIQANRMTSAYTLLRLGLMTNGDDAFAKAMIAVAPNRAGDDFLPYLAKATVEELRQLNQTNVNVYTCLVILRYYTTNPPPVAHPDFNQIFLYAVSRNQGLSDLATRVIDIMMTGNKEFLALALAQQPAWVQVAFIEDAKRRETPNLASFLGELKDLSIHEEVTEAVDEKN